MGKNVSIEIVGGDYIELPANKPVKLYPRDSVTTRLAFSLGNPSDYQGVAGKAVLTISKLRRSVSDQEGSIRISVFDHTSLAGRIAEADIEATAVSQTFIVSSDTPGAAVVDVIRGIRDRVVDGGRVDAEIDGD